MKIIEFDQVIHSLSMHDAISVMDNCFKDYQRGLFSQPERLVELLPDGQNSLFAMMPAYLGKERVFGSKVITSFPKNIGTEFSSHMGHILLFDSAYGQPVALIDANAITAIRTAAVSGLSTNYLAKKDASTLAIIGAGQQAYSHLDAMMAVRKLQEVRIFDLNPEQIKKFITTMRTKYPEIDFVSGHSIQETVFEADIICTLTPSKEAFLKAEWIASGAHINAIGTFTPTTREITSELMAISKIYVDDYRAISKESGDYLIPLQEGILTEDSLFSSLGELVSGLKEARTNEQEITLFDGVGLAIEDICCAEYILNQM